MLDAGPDSYRDWILDIGYWILDTGYIEKIYELRYYVRAWIFSLLIPHVRDSMEQCKLPIFKFSYSHIFKFSYSIPFVDGK